MLKKPVFILIVLVLVGLVAIKWSQNNILTVKPAKFWSMQAIDTVKYSRDVARQFAKDQDFDQVIDEQAQAIARTGATHIAISTPYDDEFIPFMSRWVESARKYQLKVWFRGNFSGWERWFGYASISREEHLALLTGFIKSNGNLFEDGDIFTSCTECENGGPGDPRRTGDVTGHRQFLIDEYRTAKEAFRLIGKNVTANYFPMNGDVANLIMDQATTQALGGVVVIDHYVATPEILDQNVTDLSRKSGGKVVIGEFGAPIPGIHPKMTEAEQAEWLNQALQKLVANPNVIGINYWTGFGGTTKLWRSDGEATPAVSVLAGFFTPKNLRGRVINEAGEPIGGAQLSESGLAVTTGERGQFALAYLQDGLLLRVMADGYEETVVTNVPNGQPITVVLKKKNEDFIFRLKKLIYF